jgi:tRNA A-37 threonylcarbamoyl transferase component Bud32
MSVDSLIGQTLGQYRVDSFLGSGGMARVYKGTHVLLERPVAVKVMLQHLAQDPSFRTRFLQEGRSVAALSHPNIVGVYDFGQQDSTFYLVMELITDGSLQTLLAHRDAGGWTLPLGLDLVSQAAEGLAFAHARGMVHRDIKPDNLLLRKIDDGGAAAAHPYQVKISDFGLARLAEGGVLTMTGLTMGTPAYMSPEQCQGLELDGRSDLYSLGVVLYEVTTGILPFAAKSLTEAVYKHVYTEPSPPRQIKPDVDPALEAIILRCLAKKPAERFATGGELVAALHSLGANAGGTMLMPVVPPLTAAATMLGPVAAGMPTPPSVAPAPPAVPSFPHGPAGPLPGETVVRAPAASVQPPALPSLYGRVTAPQVLALNAAGATLATAVLSGDGLTVGRIAGNGIVLEDPSISRHHLRIDWDGARATVTDLGSANGAWLASARLLPQLAQPWNPDDWLRAGPFWLRLQTPIAASSPDRLAGAPSRPLTAPPAVDPGRIRVLLDAEALSITPGQPVLVRLTLANFGTTVDHFTISVEGIPASWAKGPEQAVQLNPHAQSNVVLNVLVPRAPGSFAGQYPVTVRARSREEPDESGTATTLWTVLPFEATTASLAPQRASGRSRAGYVLALSNGGNAPARYALHGQDDEQQLRYRFAQESVALDPFRSTSVPLVVSAPLRLLGRPIVRNFTIQGRVATTVPPVGAPGEFVHKALLPSWIVAVPPVLVAVFLLLRMLLQPSIDAFQAVPLSPVAGQPFYLTWQVHHAQHLEILPEHIQVDPKTDRYIFPNGVNNPEALTLVASNVFGRVQKNQDVTVVQATPTPTAVVPTATSTAVPPTVTATAEPGVPLIGRWQATAPAAKVLDAATLEVPPGTLVTLTWQVSSADAVEIDGIGTVDPSGSLQRAVPATTTFTLKASNKGLHPVSRAIQVVVVAPTAVLTPTATTAPIATPAPTATPIPAAVIGPTAPPPAAPTSAPAVPPSGGGVPGGKNWDALAVGHDNNGNEIIWSANADDGVVRRINVQSRAQALIPVGKDPTSLLVTDAAIWVANGGDAAVQRLDPQSGQPVGTPIAVGKNPTALTLVKDAAGKDVILVANSDDGTVQAIDPQTNQAQPPVTLAKGITAMAASMDSLWLAVGPDDTVRRITLQNGRPKGTAVTIAVGKGPSAIALERSAAGKETIWVAEAGAGAVQSIDPRSNKASQPIAVGKAPGSLALEQGSAGRDLIWVANSGEATVQAIDGNAGAVVATAPVTANPSRLATGKDQVWVLNRHNGNVQGVKVSG